jgi:hypothetical protein
VFRSAVHAKAAGKTAAFLIRAVRP